MHEFALAESVIVAAVKVAEDNGLSRVDEIVTRIGELQQIGMDSFKLGLKTAIEPRKALVGEANVRIETEKAAFECRVCRRAWSFDEAKKALGGEESESIHFVPEIAHAFLRCPACGSPDFKVTKGRGVWLESVKGEKP